jgi:hypothetical protein
MKSKVLVSLAASFTLLISPNTAEAKITTSDRAQVNTQCGIKGREALTLKGAVVCNGKKWILVKEKSETIQSKAYRSILERWNARKKTELSLAIYADPKAGDWTKRLSKGIYAGAEFWGTSESDGRSIPVIISDDYRYIERTLEKLKIRQDPLDKKRNAQAQGGQAGFHGSWDDPNAYWDFLYTNSDARNNSGFWQVPAHEYSHFAQSKLSNKKWSDAGRLPWIDEGVPSYIGAVLGPMSAMPGDIMNAWKSDVMRTKRDLSFFGSSDEKVYSSPDWGDVYPLGAVAVEGLVALVGFEAIYQHYVDISGSLSLEGSYEKNFGLSGKELTKFLDDYVQSVKNGSPWTLTELQTKYKVKVG